MPTGLFGARKSVAAGGAGAKKLGMFGAKSGDNKGDISTSKGIGPSVGAVTKLKMKKL